MIRLTIVGDVLVYREGLAHALGREEGIVLVGTAASAAAADELVEAEEPDIVLVDLGMPNALDVVRRFAARPGVRVVALAVPDHEAAIVACAEAGMAGLVTRDASFADLVEAISSAARGELACSPRIAATLLRRIATLAARQPAGPADRLTDREREVATLLGERLSNKEIAKRLCIEVATVKNHVHNILKKLEMERRGDVAGALGTPEHQVTI